MFAKGSELLVSVHALRVWGGRDCADEHLVRTYYVRRLRNKLGEDARNLAYIFNERGGGHRMAEPGSAE